MSFSCRSSKSTQSQSLPVLPQESRFQVLYGVMSGLIPEDKRMRCVSALLKTEQLQKKHRAPDDFGTCFGCPYLSRGKDAPYPTGSR